MQKVNMVNGNSGWMGKKGFTLIEVLIAIFIFSMVIGIVFGSFQQISVSAKVIDKSSDAYEMAYLCIDRMAIDIESVYVRQKPLYTKPGIDSDPDPHRIEGETDLSGTVALPVLRFTSQAHLPIDRDFRKGIAEIVYYLDGNEKEGFLLKRSDRISFEEEFQKKDSDPVLCKQIKTMKIRYYDSEGEEYDDWDSDSDEYGYATPSSIRILFEIDDDGIVLPFETQVALRSVREKTE